MTNATSTASDRLHLRIAPEYKNLVSRAAALRGNSVAEFARAAAIEKAQQVLKEDQVILIAQHQTTAFYEILNGDSEPTKAAQAAAKKYRETNITSR